MQKSIEIKKQNNLKPAQIKEIMAIERISFNNPWSEAMFLSNNERYILALCNNKIVGYLCYSIVVDECHILNVAVHPDFRRRGVAQKMFDSLFEEGDRDGIAFYYLEVKVSNTPAINFYKKNGFEEIGIRKGYYENGSDAIVMVK